MHNYKTTSKQENDSTGDVMLEVSAKSASTVPKSNWLCLISGSNMPRIITKTNRDPSYRPDPQGAARELLTSQYFIWTSCSAIALALSSPEKI